MFRGPGRRRRWIAASAAMVPALWLATASAAPPAGPTDQPLPPEPAVEDPTGGGYTTPTLLFVPASAVPAWTVRAITSLDVQGPTTADRLAAGTSVGFQPGVGGEVGLPAGFTLGAGTNWVGGDTSPTPVSGGLSPYVQARFHIAGSADGRGLQLGTSVTYKFVGFQGDPGEGELALSGQYRQSHYELGLQAVMGKDFATADADAELHAYALYRVLPQLGVGAATQMRFGVVTQPGESTYDIVGGGIASLTLGRWQLAGLGGATTLGVDPGQVGALGQIFGTARF